MLQVTALSAYHRVGVAVVGFVADDHLHPEDSTIAFTNSGVIPLARIAHVESRFAS